MKILLIDQNYSFTTDIESRMILSDDFETEIITLNNVDETQAKLKMFSPDRIVLNADILQYYPDWDYNIPVTCYARNADTLKLAAEKGISCYLSLLSVIIQHLPLLQLFLHSLLQHHLLLHPCYLYPCCLFLLHQLLQCLCCHQKELLHHHISR